MMAGGTWQVRFDIDGAGGRQTGSVPVVAVPISVLKMDKGMGTVLALLGLFLVLSMAGIVAASVSEARLQPGVQPTLNLRRRAIIATAGSLVFMALAVMLGGHWWNVEAADYSENIYRPVPLEATLSGNQLDLKTGKPRPERSPRRPSATPDGYLLDHGKVMHLYAIREPEMDAAFHLHPSLVQVAISGLRCRLCLRAVTNSTATWFTPAAFPRRCSRPSTFLLRCRALRSTRKTRKLYPHRSVRVNLGLRINWRPDTAWSGIGLLR